MIRFVSFLIFPAAILFALVVTLAAAIVLPFFVLLLTLDSLCQPPRYVRR